ncbi:MAG: glutathione S-transferase family protein [Halobacteriovoraceae bacterium]|nr:glutathione S-transferase family protein [Halobacteriovoraceae bacterium]
MIKLFGSQASPYVRRIRLMLNEDKYEFIKIDIFSKEGQKELSRYTQTKRVPVLVDGEQVIWDSYLITKYLLNRPLTIEEEKKLILINEANDSGIVLFQMKRFDLDPNHKNIYSKIQEKRIAGILELFNEEYGSREFKWDLEEQWLYCMLDWFKYREVFAWEDSFPNLKRFYTASCNKKGVSETAPQMQ